MPTRRSKTANITKEDSTSQHSDILAMSCKVMNTFIIRQQGRKTNRYRLYTVE